MALLVLAGLVSLAGTSPYVHNNTIQTSGSEGQLLRAPSYISENMTSLVSDMLAVLNGSSTKSTAAQYQQIIQSNATYLHSLGEQSSTASQELRAGLVCTVSKLLFGSNTIVSGSSSYTTEQEENW